MFTSDDIEVFTQSSIHIIDRGRRIYIDPFQMREEPHDADFILITHDHYDHFSPEDIVKVASGKSVLIIPEKAAEMAQQVEGDNIGNVGKIVTVTPGTYTMDARKAAELINNIKPRIAIPTHYGSIVGKKEDADIFAAAVREPVKVEVKMKY